MCRRRHPRRRFRCARQPQSVPQLRQHRRVSDGIACYLDVAYLQRLRIDAQWTLRHSLRYSAPCFLRFHSPSPMNLMPVLSTSSCSADLVRWWRSSTCKVFWHRQTVLKSGTGQYSLANCSRLSLHHAHRLPQGLAEQALDAQAELDGCVRACRSACQTIASPSPATSSTNRCLQVCPEAEPA